MLDCLCFSGQMDIAPPTAAQLRYGKKLSQFAAQQAESAPLFEHKSLRMIASDHYWGSAHSYTVVMVTLKSMYETSEK